MEGIAVALLKANLLFASSCAPKNVTRKQKRKQNEWRAAMQDGRSRREPLITGFWI